MNHDYIKHNYEHDCAAASVSGLNFWLPGNIFDSGTADTAAPTEDEEENEIAFPNLLKSRGWVTAWRSFCPYVFPFF